MIIAKSHVFSIIKFWILVFIANFFCIRIYAQYNPYNYSIQRSITCEKGAVVSAHPLASKVGVAILKEGGNAFDAAIATQLALAVVYPGAGNIGGGGFLLGYDAKGNAIALDYREKAPARSYRDMYLDAAGNAQTQLSQNGHLASGVPGTVAGLFATMKHAKLPFKKLIQPAIELAEKGFVLTESEAKSLNNTMQSFVLYNTMPNVFIKFGGWKTGDTLVQPDLAKTLERIRDQGQKGFYEGITAELIVAEMKRGGGIISLDDLKAYQAVERKVMRSTYKGYTILGMPLPSSGGIIIEQLLGMTAPFDIAHMGFLSAHAVQLMIEAERRAYADRAALLGDADFVKVPLEAISSAAYYQQRMQNFKQGVANTSDQIRAGVAVPESEETTHLSVYDASGNAVAVTTTLNGGYGSRTVVGGAGFLLNNEMDDFSIKPGVPNMYGALGTNANAIAPGKRMLSSMTPTIVLKDNKPYLVIGTPGGTTIPTSVFQTIVNILDFNLSTEDAVWKPKFHHQWQPDVVYVEKGFPTETAEKLKAMGYKIIERGAIGRTEVIKITNGKIEAVADYRGDDHAEGFAP